MKRILNISKICWWYSYCFRLWIDGSLLIIGWKHKLVAENSGILPVAAAKKLNIKGKKIVAVVSGGNID